MVLSFYLPLSLFVLFSASDNPTSVIISDSKQNLKDTAVTSTNATQTPAATTTTTVTTNIPLGLGGGGSSGGLGGGSGGGSSLHGSLGNTLGIGGGSTGCGGGLTVGTTSLSTGNHLDVPQSGNPNLLSPDVLNQRRGKLNVE